LILNTDIIIHVGGIPLLGINLKACLAGMETMLKYGIWRDWDEAQRAVATEEQRRKKGVPLATDEEVILKMFASQWYSKGIYHNWRPGHLHITDRRVLLFRKEPAEILFQCPYDEIKGMVTERKNNITGKETDYLYLWLGSGEVAQLHPSDAQAVKDAIEERMKALGLELEETIPLPTLDETARKFLSEEEQLVHSGKMSHLVAEPRPGGITTDVWKPGHLYLTSQRLVWWYDFDGKVALEVPLDKISGVEAKRKDLGGMLKDKLVLNLIYQNGVNGSRVASFSDAVEELNQWQDVISKSLAGSHKDIDAESNTEECPGCGRRFSVDQLLKWGCPACGWVSYRLKRKDLKIQNECK
jgi:predicted RNA-binding Zn-ribbon protein involved in translation (DUF1610 family)